MRAFSLPNRNRRPKAEAKSGGGLIRFILTVALLAWAIRSLLVTPFSIPSGSMLPALYVGDYVLTAKWSYGYSRFSFPFHFPPFEGRILSDLPDRGDVAVFRPDGSDVEVVKRVIGLPGDTVELRDGEVWLNGEALAREPIGTLAVPVSANSPCDAPPQTAPREREQAGDTQCLYPAFRETLPNGISYAVLDQTDSRADHFSAVTVPEGHLFLMGDNRDRSLDSRYGTIEGGIGFVPVERLVGRALFTFWSTDGSAEYWKPWTWFTALRAGRIGNGYSEPAND